MPSAPPRTCTSAVVHDFANRRFGIRGYFDKVEIGIRGDAEGVFDAHDAHLLPAWSDETDLRYAYALVDAGLSADVASPWSACFRLTARCTHRTTSEDATPTAAKALHKQGPGRPITADSRLRMPQNEHLKCPRPDR